MIRLNKDVYESLKQKAFLNLSSLSLLKKAPCTIKKHSNDNSMRH